MKHEVASYHRLVLYWSIDLRIQKKVFEFDSILPDSDLDIHSLTSIREIGQDRSMKPHGLHTTCLDMMSGLWINRSR